jgi:hypothetical protein
MKQTMYKLEDLCILILILNCLNFICIINDSYYDNQSHLEQYMMEDLFKCISFHK